MRRSPSVFQLLEDHLQKEKEDLNGEPHEEDDEKAWVGWEIESDASDDSSSEEEAWINVDDDENPLEISDSEDEKDATKPSKEEEDAMITQAAPARVSTLATTKVVPFVSTLSRARLTYLLRSSHQPISLC